jgi:LacI family transcriptional regulator
MGIDVPGEISVTGFDNITLSEVVTPSLTTLHIPGIKSDERSSPV